MSRETLRTLKAMKDEEIRKQKIKSYIEIYAANTGHISVNKDTVHAMRYPDLVPFSIQFYQLLATMVHPNPDMRPSAVIAAKQFEELMKN